MSHAYSIQPTTRQTCPKIYENISIRISKTGNPIRKLNSDAGSAKEPHNNISKTQIFVCFSTFFAMPANVTSRTKIQQFDQTWAHLGPIFGLSGRIFRLFSLWARSWPISSAMLDRLEGILDRSTGYVSHTVQFFGVSRKKTKKRAFPLCRKIGPLCR